VSERTSFKDLSPDELRERLEAQGHERFRADQLLAWVYRRGVAEPEAMTDLSKALREELCAEWNFRPLSCERIDVSKDGTRKFSLRTNDGALIESVVIPEARRNTLCVSTQVGCALACSFCATGAMGFDRNLQASEIVDQLCIAREVLGADDPITNIVFMGMGEPLMNLPNVLRAIEIFIAPKAFAMAPRRITVSTVGVISRIGPLLEAAPVNLAVSLHATTNAVRDELVPLNRSVPLESLLGTLRSEPRITPRRPVFFEYTLMAGVNDSPEDAGRLPNLLRGIPCRINVIPMNPHPDAPQRAPEKAVVDRFTQVLHEAGMIVTLRRSRGSDIAAACGQLARRAPREATTQS